MKPHFHCVHSIQCNIFITSPNAAGVAGGEGGHICKRSRFIFSEHRFIHKNINYQRNISIKLSTGRRLLEYIPPRQSCFHMDKEILLKSSRQLLSQMQRRQKTTTVVPTIQIVIRNIGLRTLLAKVGKRINIKKMIKKLKVKI